MSTETDDFINFSDDEALLVEYLDGELSIQDRRRVEERLGREPELRESLARLEKSWQFLDLLERERTDKDLVETTLETVVFSMEESLARMEEKKTSRPRWKTFVAAVLPIVLLLLTLLVSVHVGSVVAPDKNFFLRVATPMIRDLDMYRMILEDDPDLELLRELARRRVFLPPQPEGADPVDPALYRPSPETRVNPSLTMCPSPTEMENRFQQIDNLEGALYSQFYWNSKTFDNLSWEKRDKLRGIYQSIIRTPLHDELIRTLQNYYNWKRSLQSYERRELDQGRTLPASDRADRIVSLKNRLDVNLPKIPVTVPRLDDLLDGEEGFDPRELAKFLGEMDTAEKDRILSYPPKETLGLLKELRDGKTDRREKP